MNIKTAVTSTLSVASLLLLSACGGGSSQAGSGGPGETFQLHWSWSPSTAGFAVAQDKHLYQNDGLNLSITPGKGSGTAVQLVSTGKADMGIADSVAITQAVQQGAPLLVVATINQETNTAMQVLDSSGIKTIADLKGKSVAVPPGGAYSFLFPIFLQSRGLTENDVKITTMPFESMVPSLIAGRVDAIVGGQDSHVALAAQGTKFTDFPFGQNGVNAAAHSIFTTKSYASNNSDVVKKVVAASLQGWSDARANPQEALADIKKLAPDTVENNAREELNVLLPLLCAGSAKYIGLTSPERWQQTVSLLQRAKLVTNAPDPKTFVSYDYLPPQSALKPCN
ncbi:ABC transporter substrate-binding protein [Amycolatopsis sp. NPDC051371]|uniref:ABC transporter substrate-binding protein n=1 Tax=Amycolatopsis sp. NPDC051371 TaxID=3155800 RepID=UPI0034128A02